MMVEYIFQICFLDSLIYKILSTVQETNWLNSHLAQKFIDLITYNSLSSKCKITKLDKWTKAQI